MPLLGVLALIGILVLISTILHFVRRKDRKKEAAEKQKMLEEGIKLGHLTKDGFPTCIICGAQATECAPITGLSWMDKVPLLNRLFALPPRYVIVDAVSRGFEYCKIHKDVANAKLEEFHGLLRAERGRFNAAQAEKVAKMDGGGLVMEVQRYHKDVVSYLQETIEDTDKVRHLLPAASQSDHTAVSTLSSTPKDNDPLEGFEDVS